MTLFPPLDHRIDAPGPCARRGDVEEHEAIENGQLAAIEGWIEAPWRMCIEISNGAHARDDDGGGPREQADHQKDAADQLDEARIAVHRVENEVWLWRRKLQQLARSVLQQQQARHDPQNAEQHRRPGSSKHFDHYNSPELNESLRHATGEYQFTLVFWVTILLAGSHTCCGLPWR